MRHRSFYLDLLAVAASVLAISGSLLMPGLVESLKYYLLALVMITVGIPHGAVDHIISSKLYNLSKTLADQIKFYLPYLALMLFMGLIWYFNAQIGFLIFIACTVYHFGQADLVYLTMPEWFKKVLYVSRGVMIMGLLIFIHPSISFPVMDAIAGIDLLDSAFWTNYSLWIGLALAAQHILLVSLAVISYRRVNEARPSYVIGDTLLVTALYLLAEPITAFAVYFAFWHSMGHIQELKAYFSTQDRQWSVTEFYKHSWLFSLISFLGLALLYWLNQAFGSDQQMLAILLILISVLTLPHMLVVEKMFSDHKSALS